MPTHDGPPYMKNVQVKKKKTIYDTNDITVEVCDQQKF